MAIVYNVIDQMVSGELSCTQTVPVFCEAQNKSEIMTMFYLNCSYATLIYCKQLVVMVIIGWIFMIHHWNL